MTTFSHSAMVDVIAQPVELVVTHPDQREESGEEAHRGESSPRSGVNRSFTPPQRSLRCLTPS